jgi:hypothetical protein
MRAAPFFILMLFVSSINGVAVISIGASCNLAMALRKFNLRQASYPFDWLISPFESLYQAISEDFQHFFEPNSLTLRMSDRYGVLDYYGFHFVHDLPSTNPNTSESDAIDPGENHMLGGFLRDDWRDFVPMVQEKYQRRIKRLHDLLSSSEMVYLIRLGDMVRAQAIQFRDLLTQKYPNLQFVLVVIGRNSEAQGDWNLENIKNFYIPLHQEENYWQTIFEALCLI